MNLHPGMPVLYRWRGSQVRGGNIDAAAMILRVRANNACDLIIHPAGAREPLYFDDVSLMDQEHLTHCWRLPPTLTGDDRVAALEQRIIDLEEALTGGRAATKKTTKAA